MAELCSNHIRVDEGMRRNKNSLCWTFVGLVGGLEGGLALDNIYSVIVADGRCSVALVLMFVFDVFDLCLMSLRDRPATLANYQFNQIKIKMGAGCRSFMKYH